MSLPSRRVTPALTAPGRRSGPAGGPGPAQRPGTGTGHAVAVAARRADAPRCTSASDGPLPLDRIRDKTAAGPRRPDRLAQTGLSSQVPARRGTLRRIRAACGSISFAPPGGQKG